MRQRGKMKTVKHKMSDPLPPDMTKSEKKAWAEWKRTFADDYIAQYTAAIRKFLESKGHKKRQAGGKPQRRK
jgi:hypothetical protein